VLDELADCPFCVVIQNGDYEDFGLAIAFRDAHPVTEGHRLIVPRRHVESFFDMSGAERFDVGEAVLALRTELTDSDTSITGFNLGINVGESAGQTVRHAHVHFIPRRDSDTDSRTVFTKVLTL
jgi:diadenosine tetraphosphate (Ap4A) HIT family hydrolase